MFYRGRNSAQLVMLTSAIAFSTIIVLAVLSSSLVSSPSTAAAASAAVIDEHQQQHGDLVHYSSNAPQKSWQTFDNSNANLHQAPPPISQFLDPTDEQPNRQRGETPRHHHRSYQVEDEDLPETKTSSKSSFVNAVVAIFLVVWGIMIILIMLALRRRQHEQEHQDHDRPARYDVVQIEEPAPTILRKVHVAGERKFSTCTICLEDIERRNNDVTMTTTTVATGDEDEQEVATLMCSHQFHVQCLNDWASSGYSTLPVQCPLCRDTITIA